MEEVVWRSIAIELDREIVSAIKYHLSPGVIYYVLIVVAVFDATTTAAPPAPICTLATRRTGSAKLSLPNKSGSS